MADIHETRRGSSRGAGERGSNLRSTFRQTGATRLSLSEAAKVHRVADTVRDKARDHHERHREKWVLRQYARLLSKSALTLALHPPGITVDPKAVLMQRARKEVAHRHVQRIARIDKARKSMLTGSGLRPTRKVEWGDKIAEPMNAKKANAQDRQPLSTASRSVTAKIAVAQDRARRKAEAHLVQHQEKWTATRYNNLTSAFALSTGKLPEKEAQHVRDAAMDAANRSVRAKHEARLERIDASCVRMRANGVVRKNRLVGRNIGLNE